MEVPSALKPKRKVTNCSVWLNLQQEALRSVRRKLNPYESRVILLSRDICLDKRVLEEDDDERVLEEEDERVLEEEDGDFDIF